jgi:nucleotide-binding universal stress UspA family protein
LEVKCILVPIDWSEPSQRAFDIAASLAHEHKARLIVLYVIPLASVMYGPPTANYTEHMHDELCRMRPADPQIPVQHMIAEGDPASIIQKVARENQCDLIVMGTHGRTALPHVLMGSVAEEVVRKAPCLVLTVKTGVVLHEV